MKFTQDPTGLYIAVTCPHKPITVPQVASRLSEAKMILEQQQTQADVFEIGTTKLVNRVGS